MWWYLLVFVVGYKVGVTQPTKPKTTNPGSEPDKKAFDANKVGSGNDNVSMPDAKPAAEADRQNPRPPDDTPPSVPMMGASPRGALQPLPVRF